MAELLTAKFHSLSSAVTSVFTPFKISEVVLRPPKQLLVYTSMLWLQTHWYKLSHPSGHPSALSAFIITTLHVPGIHLGSGIQQWVKQTPRFLELTFLLRQTDNKHLDKDIHAELPWWPSGWDSVLPVQGVQVRALVGELDPECHNKDFMCHN